MDANEFPGAHDDSRWAVSYHSAGCMPDGDVVTFDDPDDARAYMWEEWCDVLHRLGTSEDVDAWQGKGDEIQATIATMGLGVVSDPRIGSLYRWEFTLRCPRCGNTNVRPPAGYRLALCMGGCGTAFDTMV